jgi:hypothetical protein
MPAKTDKQRRAPQYISEDTLQKIEDLIADARAGKVTDITVVANLREEGNTFRCSTFTDPWRFLGALEYAKRSVFRVIDAE